MQKMFCFFVFFWTLFLRLCGAPGSTSGRSWEKPSNQDTHVASCSKRKAQKWEVTGVREEADDKRVWRVCLWDLSGQYRTMRCWFSSVDPKAVRERWQPDTRAHALWSRWCDILEQIKPTGPQKADWAGPGWVCGRLNQMWGLWGPYLIVQVGTRM